MASHLTRLTRRQALKRAIALVGGTAALARLGPLAARVPATDKPYVPQLLSARQFATATHVVDVIIPETDTPGALAANVHVFIDLMLAEWATAETAAVFTQSLERIDSLANERYAMPFATCEKARQLELLQQLDRAAYAEGAADTSFRRLKKLVLFGYYSSEEGASVELEYTPIPGPFQGCVMPGDDARSSFGNTFAYGL